MAPEIIARKPYQGQDIDIFAYGTMLLVLSLMDYPFTDASMDDDGYKRLCEKPADFWNNYERRGKVYSEDFKSFISLTTAPSPELRLTMTDLLGHKWMRGQFTKKDDFAAKYNPIMERTLSKRDNGQEALNVDFQIAEAGRRRGMRGNRGGDSSIDLNENWATSNGRKFGPVVSLGLGLQCTTFTVLGQPLKIMEHLRDTLDWYDEDDEDKQTLKLSKSAWKAQVVVHRQDFNDKGENEDESASHDGPGALISAEIHEIEMNSKYMISLVRKQGDGIVFAKEAYSIKQEFKKACP